MDFQEFVDGFSAMTCVISVEKKGDGSYGDICIEVGNKAYMDSVKKESSSEPVFTPGANYMDFIPRDLNFENFCYRSAVLKQPLHSYIHIEGYNRWFNIFFLPLQSDNPHKAYCSYTQELSEESDPEKIGKLSNKPSADVLKTCIKLHSFEDIRKSGAEILKDIRKFCEADYSCIMLTDFKEGRCSLFSESIKEGSGIRSLSEFLSDSFIKYAATWLDTIGNSNCLIIKNEQDMDFVKERNPEWHRSLQIAKVKSIILFPLQHDNETIGFFWATGFNTDNVLQIKETLELTTFFVSSEIANYRKKQTLIKYANNDILTGAQSANAMFNRAKWYREHKEAIPQNYAIVLAKLKGLREINQKEGLELGDCLLKEAVFLLKSVFEDGEVFRIGGNKFAVLLQKVERDTLEQGIEKLRKESETPDDISFVVGYFYAQNGEDLDVALQKADLHLQEQKV